MKTSISMADIISRLEKLDEQYINQSSSAASSTVSSTINTTDSEYSSAYSSVSGSRPSTPPPNTPQIPLNVLNIEDGVCRYYYLLQLISSVINNQSLIIIELFHAKLGYLLGRAHIINDVNLVMIQELKLFMLSH